MNKVFLGGTCNGSQWREILIPKLIDAKIDYFNPVVEDWTPECQEEEIRQRETCDYVLYTITPKMLGTYSIAEVVDDSNKRPFKTLFLVLDEDDGETWKEHEIKSLNAVKKLVSSNKGAIFNDFGSVVNYISLLSK